MIRGRKRKWKRSASKVQEETWRGGGGEENSQAFLRQIPVSLDPLLSGKNRFARWVPCVVPSPAAQSAISMRIKQITFIRRAVPHHVLDPQQRHPLPVSLLHVSRWRSKHRPQSLSRLQLG
mmetsp:Transcript_24156/g.54255  ORF Transcript_24156/g.54255 Transcript_24156/m.54255 type:complete len:121 (+) Transcript_24156:46-408(+)